MLVFRFLLIVLVFTLAACSTQAPRETVEYSDTDVEVVENKEEVVSKQKVEKTSESADEQDNKNVTVNFDSHADIAALLDKGIIAISERRTKAALKAFDDAIILCANVITTEHDQVLAARTQKEAKRYIEKTQEEGKSALLINSECSDAYFFKGYTHVDIGKLEIAMEYVDKAVNMAPLNSMYISELGHLAHISEQWGDALEIFQYAEYAADNFSPEPLRIEELARAKRGVGFSYIELGQLDAAEKKLKECLVLNKNDQKAQHELKYIEKLRAKSQLKSM